MTLAAIAEYLRALVGLAESALGPGVLERSVRRRMRDTQSPDYAAYLKLIERFPDEVQLLINDVTVPETSFFRDPGVFRALTEIAVRDWLAARTRSTLKVLSIPCSTGEEPYSIAMALLDAGMPADRFSIEGIDISQRVLATARRAIYGNGSFRGRELDFRDRYFHRIAQGWELDPQVQACVRIRHGNLLDPALAAQTYDVVFCRNLLIYFDATIQAEAMRRLDALVAPGGVLFLGSAETFLARGTAFQSLGRPMSFGFRKTGTGTEGPGSSQPAQNRMARRKRARPVATAHESTARPRTAAAAAKTAPVGEPPAKSSVPSACDVSSKAVDLDWAEELANSGRLEEAAESCRNYLDRYGPNARAYFLLGVACNALGDGGQALSWFRKVVYLEPGHEQALMHLALLSRERGATNQAAHLERRARSSGRTEGEA